MLVGWLLAALLAAPVPGLQSGKAQPAAAAPRVELVRGLLGLAKWANQSELFVQRDGVWRSVLLLEPDNDEARKGLRYTRDGTGRWKDPPAREVKDRKPALLPEFARRRSELVAVWRTQVLAELDAASADPARRAAAWDEILRIDPEDEVVRGLRGEVRADKSWMLAETLAAPARRLELQSCVQQARTTAPKPEPCTPAGDDLGYLPAWKLGHSCEGVRLLSQSDEAESLALLSTGHAARALLALVCGKPLSPSPGFSAYVVVSAGECDQLVAAVKDCTDAERGIWRSAPGFGIPHRAAVVLWDKDAHRRLDCFTRHLVANCLFAAYGIDSRQGWLVDGLGLYLGQQLTGTRCTWFRPDRADEDRALRLRMLDEKSNWNAEARKYLEGPSALKLADVLGKPVGELTLEELLVGTAFSAYLVETQGKALPEILERIGRGGNASETIAHVCARPFPEFEARFVRWLSEVH
jgi:hypothetical protein